MKTILILCAIISAIIAALLFTSCQSHTLEQQMRRQENITIFDLIEYAENQK